MEYKFLYPNEPLPAYIRIISLFMSIIFLCIGIFMKLTETQTVFDISLVGFRTLFLISVILHLASKTRVEDERVKLLRLQILRFGYALIVGIILMMEIGKVLGDNHEIYKNFIQWIISILSVQVIYYELFQKTSLADFLSSHKFYYFLFYLIIAGGLVNLNFWLW